MKKTAVFCPLFNQENILEELSQNELNFDKSGLFRPLEMILFPNQNLLTKVVNHNICKVSSPNLDSNQIFFTFNRLLVGPNVATMNSQDNRIQNVLENLHSHIGRPYVWGGNWVLEDEKFNIYKDLFFDHSPSFLNHLRYLFSGLDCSGLLYAATFGASPRNTRELVNFGEPLKITGLSNKSILSNVRPLDLVVWKGHVLIFLNQKELIESRHGYGVVKVDALLRLDEIRESREPSEEASEKTFLIRRWASS